jgi:hypothetical protein
MIGWIFWFLFGVAAGLLWRIVAISSIAFA